MRQWLWLGCAAMLLGAQGAHARGSEGSRTNSLLLNGAWEWAFGEGTEAVDSLAAGASLPWRKVNLPGPFAAWNQDVANHTKCVWARRTFTVTAAQSESLAVLRWNRIANGAIAFINGRKVGENEPTGPYQVLVAAGILRPGDNEIVLKVRGAASVPRSRSGNALIPAGFGVGMPEVTDDLWIDFADRAYLKWVLALPDLAGSRVQLRVTPVGLQPLNELKLFASVKTWPAGKLMGEGQTLARVVPATDPLGGEHFMVEVPMPGFKAWTFEECPLYTAEVRLTQAGRVLDQVECRFGMRELRVKDRNYQLNGRNLWLRGSNLVFEWDWGDTITGHELEYLVTEAREMNMNSFRTHTRPPPRRWADLCDEHGTMILAEFPVLFNYQDYKFTTDEWEVWHRNCLVDAVGWMARLWNHPAVIMWVLSNESRGNNAWEEGPFQEFVNALDPTRPTMRTGSTGTKENYDVHPCGNVTETDEGHLQPAVAGWFNEAGQRTTTASEYMNDFGHPRTQWTGVDDRLANSLAVAQIGAEHTEAMRRARVDAILPYMYAGWTRTRLAARVRETGKGSAVWKDGYAAPESAAWHSSLSPVLASLDLFDPDYRPGQEVTTDLHLINDSWHDAQVHVDLLLTHECPEYLPEAKCFDQPIRKWSFDFALPADGIRKLPVNWKLPDTEGTYWLTARLTGLSGRPVLSQRLVRAISPAVVSGVLRQRAYALFGATDTARAFFKTKNLRIADDREPLSPEKHVAVVWNASHLTGDEKDKGKALCGFAAQGGRVIVLAASSWDWPELCDLKLRHEPRFSRVFPYGDLKGSPLEGIDPRWLVRWNGFPGTVAVGSLEGGVMARATKLLWAKEPKTTLLALVPAASGTGQILFSQLELQRRVDPSQPDFDPAAERVLLQLLGSGSL